MIFVNPYNFTPIPAEIRKDAPGEGSHTGCITYQITTRTSLFIPNTTSIKAFPSFTEEKIRKAHEKDPEKMKKALEKHRSYDFYSYRQLDPAHDYTDDPPAEPVIPGSELRGMVRSLYETLTDSCLRVLNESAFVPKRTAEVFKLGLIRREGVGEKASYTLHETRTCCIYLTRESVKACREGALVYFYSRDNNGFLRTDEVSLEPKNGSGRGYILKGMLDKTGKKKNAHIAVVTDATAGKTKKNVTKEDLERLKLVLESYQDEPGADKSYEDYKKGLEDFLNGRSGQEYYPVYYSFLDNNLYLSPASITKEISFQTVGHAASGMKPCKNRKEVCPACRLFGMTGDGPASSRGSLVRFTDATVSEHLTETKEYYDPLAVMQVLATPKISNSEFYLQAPGGASFWTYDYCVRNGKVDPYDARIRGRKYYWHHPDFTVPKGIIPTDLNKTVRSVRKNISFTGKVYFEGISDLQLRQLLWILNGGREGDSKSGEICYKLGGGKPLGYGSVRLKVTDIQERSVAMQGGRWTYKVSRDMPDIPAAKECCFSPTAYRPLLTICGFTAASGRTITYPVTEGQVGGPMEEGFRWFTENHSNQEGKNKFLNRREQMNIHRTLPVLGESVTELPVSPSGRDDADIRDAGKISGRLRTSGTKAVWMARYKLSSQQMKKIKEIVPGLWIEPVMEWANEENVERLSSSYSIILLPSKTKKSILKLAMSLYQHVFRSKKQGDFDDGWEKLK